VLEYHHQSKQPSSHLQELEGRGEVKESSKGTTSSLLGAEACNKKVDFDPTNHGEKWEMTEREQQHSINSARITPCPEQS